MIPKIELHLHLEGAAPPAFIRGLAAEKSIDLSGIFDADGHYKYQNFNEFLDIYAAATSVLQSPEDFHRLTRTILAESAAHGVVYTELFLSPDFCGGGDLAAWRDYLAAMVAASNEAEAQDGITARGIVTAIRHLGPEQSRPIALCAAETAGDYIRGFGLAGDEMQGMPADYRWAFDCAREAGLGLTCHAGEWGGPQMVRATLDALPVTRIGHGVQAVEDPALLERLAEAGTVLEVCPGSNVALGVVPDWSSHPIERLRAAGVKVTVSTDDPSFFHTTMTHEYDRLSDTFGWDNELFTKLNRVALDAAFCDDATKDRIAKRLERP